MNYNILVLEIRDDPLNRGYADMDHQAVADNLNVVDREVADTERKTMREILRRYGMDIAGQIYDKLVAIGETNSGVILALKAINDYSENSGLDFSDQVTIDSLDYLVSIDALSSAEGDFLKNLGKKMVSRATELGLSQVTNGHVHSARLRIG